MTKKSRGLGNMLCPQCGAFGQLKRRWDRKKTEYFQVDHYAGRAHVNYVRSCYIGVCSTELEAKLFKMTEDKRVLTRRFRRK
jgi:hypothetical protein